MLMVNTNFDLIKKVCISKDFRLTIPINIVREIYKPNSYFKVTLSKNNVTSLFYLRLPSKKCPSKKELQVRRKLPIEIINNLQLKPNDFLIIQDIFPLNSAKSTIQITDNKFDILSLPLENIMSESFLKNGESWCRFWFSSRFGGRSKFIELKRYILINRTLGEFLGLMQAESRKYGDKFDFTNVLINEHKLFIDIAYKYFGINRNIWNLTVFFNKSKLNAKDILKYEMEFKNKLNLSPIKVYHVPHKTITNTCYSISINCRILNKIMNSLLITMRQIMIENNEDSIKDCSKGFIVKSLLGDGTAGVLADYKNLEIVLFEQDKKAQNDITKILRNFDINSNINGIRLDISTKLDSCMWFLENNLFTGHIKNRNKFLCYLKNNLHLNRMVKRFSTMDKDITISEFAKLNNLTKGTAHMYLFRNVKLGFLTSYSSNKLNFYRLSTKGKKFLDLLKEKEIIP